jgi:NAD(P)-dependent dehydrogenase (short-subunit alcohol dehydrogenase family)
MTKTIAKEWGPFGVRCNCIAFGCIFPSFRCIYNRYEEVFGWLCCIQLFRCVLEAADIETRLTQAKEKAEPIEMEGKKVSILVVFAFFISISPQKYPCTLSS